MAITKSFPGRSYSRAHTNMFHQEMCAGLQLWPGDPVSVWHSQSAATPGSFGRHPMSSATPWSDVPGTRLWSRMRCIWAVSQEIRKSQILKCPLFGFWLPRFCALSIFRLFFLAIQLPVKLHLSLILSEGSFACWSQAALSLHVVIQEQGLHCQWVVKII